jgi:ABC-2 type transport system permease protein
MSTTLTGTRHLVRLIARRDRIVIPLWTVVVATVPASYVSTIDGLYPTAAQRAEFAQTGRHSAAFVTLYGRLSGSSLGELVTWRAGFIPVIVGIIAVLTVIRHTRTDEEAGRRDLLGATVLGRHAPLAAALTATVLAGAALGLLSALVLMSQGLGPAGSLAYGAQLLGTAAAFAAVGALAAQLTSGAGAARGIGIAAVGAAFLLRVVGDLSAQAGSGAGWVAWLSPIGWVQALHPFGGDRWWVLVIPVAFAAAVTAGAVALSAHRDVGSGVLPDRPGPATAAPTLRSPLALAWRLHRGLLAAWAAGFAALGLVFGSVANSVGDLFKDNPKLADVFNRLGGAHALIDSYLAAIMSLLGLVAAAYAIQATVKLRTEESAGRAEVLLATTVGRVRWAASHATFTALGPAVALLVGGLTTGVSYGVGAHDIGGQLPRVLAAALVQLPAVWVLGALTLTLIGLAPRATVAAWGALGLCLLLYLVGAALRLNQAVLDVSPFTHVPKAPAAHVPAQPLVWLALVAIALTLAGLAGLRRRDVPVP